ncbi:hypothetical protein D915_009191 [Fasciola hepatica]|uniref:CUB domain-containing protein n=1 Tax=Fasciola hepatica TaxID=6192 RepID=A0A4E0R1G1_FASHE|nr:hypothetical protein D915_009191 [Fasciola hepatica]
MQKRRWFDDDKLRGGLQCQGYINLPKKHLESFRQSPIEMALKTGPYLVYAFSLLFTFVSAQSPIAICGNQSLHLRNGQNTFTIPERDGPRECVYNLTSENDTIINFIIVTMSIGTKEGKCDQDYITVGDSENDLPHPRYTACGGNGPQWQFYSTGNRMTVKLVVKSQLNKVSVLAVALPLHIRRNVLPECGNRVIRIGAERTEFTFPPTGISLKNETRCSYFLLGNNRGDGNMTFRFQSLNIPNKDQCRSDFVNVLNEDDFVIARHCGTTTPSNNITAAGNVLRMNVQVRTNPANSSFKGYIYHESSKPIHETSTSAPIQTTVGTKSAGTATGNSGPVYIVGKFVTVIFVMFNNWNL